MREVHHGMSDHQEEVWMSTAVYSICSASEWKNWET